MPESASRLTKRMDGFVKCSRAVIPSGLPRLTINPISRVTKPMIRCQAGVSRPLLAGCAFTQFSLRQVHAGKITAPACERDQGVLVGDVTQVDFNISLAGQQLLEFRHREPVAGMYADDGRTVRQHLIDLGLEFLGEVLQLWAQSGLQPLSGPNELGPEGSEIRAPTPMSLDQRRCEEGGPFLDQVPRMAVGDAGTPAARVILPVLRSSLRKSSNT